MANSTYHEPEDLGPEQDARDAAIPGRKYYVYVLETDFGHYVGHTARLHKRFNEHLQGDPTTINSNPRPVWNSGPFTTRRATQKFEAALKSLRDQKSRRFTDYTGLEPEPFSRHKSHSHRVERPQHSTNVETGNDIQPIHESEDSDHRHDGQRKGSFVSAGNNRRYRYRNDQIRPTRDVDVKASRIDVRKTLAWFMVVLILALVTGYILGFRDSQATLNTFTSVGMTVTLGVVCFAVYLGWRYLGQLIVTAVRYGSLIGPVVGDRRNTWIAIVLSSLFGVAIGALIGYNLGLNTAHGVIEFFTMIGTIVFLTILLAIAGYVIVKWQSSQPRRGRRSRRRWRG